MNPKLFAKAIANYKEDKDLTNWIAYLNGMKFEDVKNMSPKEINSGYCEDYAAFYNLMYGAEVYFIVGEHFVLKVDNKFYDTWNPEGVENLNDLNYFKNRSKKYTDEQLNNLLKKDNPLHYEIYSYNIPILGYTIDRYQEKYKH